MNNELIEMELDLAYKHNKKLSSINEESLIKALKEQRIKELLYKSQLFLVDLTDIKYLNNLNDEIYFDTIIGRVNSIDFENLTMKVDIKEKYINIAKKSNIAFHMIGEFNINREFIVEKIVRIGLTVK